MTPRVSVIVRSYNRLVALGELVAALLRQTYPSFEIVVVEQSTVRPPEAVRRLEELAVDARVRLVHRPPRGGAAARSSSRPMSRSHTSPSPGTRGPIRVAAWKITGAHSA